MASTPARAGRPPIRGAPLALAGDFLLILVLGALLAGLILVDARFEQPGALGWLAAPRLLLGLGYVLLAPGYCLQCALFPRADELDGSERLALCFGLSAASLPPLALVLDWLPWGLRLWPIVLGLAALMLPAAALAIWRRARLAAAQTDLFLPRARLGLRGLWRALDRTDRVLYGAMLAALLAAAGAALAILLLPSPGDYFTEFYLLGPEGLAESYPREVRAGQVLTVTVGIRSREAEAGRYLVYVQTDGRRIGASPILPLEAGTLWEGAVGFSLAQPGPEQPVDFLLERTGQPFPYRSLRLWINVAP